MENARIYGQFHCAFRPTLRIRRNDLSLMQFIYESLAEVAKRENHVPYGCIMFCARPLL